MPWAEAGLRLGRYVHPGDLDDIGVGPGTSTVAADASRQRAASSAA